MDLEQRLVGIVTDDVIDVIEQEATRDLCRRCSAAGDDDDYFSSNLFTVARRWWYWRCWCSPAFSRPVIANEDVLQRVVLLAAFIPCWAAPAAMWGPRAPRW